MGFNRRKLEDQRRQAAVKEAAARRATIRNRDALELEPSRGLPRMRDERSGSSEIKWLGARTGSQGSCRRGARPQGMLWPGGARDPGTPPA